VVAVGGELNHYVVLIQPSGLASRLLLMLRPVGELASSTLPLDSLERSSAVYD